MIENKSPKESEGVLHIRVHKPVPEIMDEYCKMIGVSPQEIGYATGVILGTKDDLGPPLINLNQHFFFAGVYYAVKYKGKFEYVRSMSKESKAELVSKIDQLRSQDNVQKSDYIG